MEFANVRAVKQDMSLIASLALSYYKTPAIIGGGGKVFNIMDFYHYSVFQLASNGRIQTENGQVEIIESNNDELKIIGYCSELDFDIDKAYIVLN